MKGFSIALNNISDPIPSSPSQINEFELLHKEHNELYNESEEEQSEDTIIVTYNDSKNKK